MRTLWQCLVIALGICALLPAAHAVAQGQEEATFRPESGAEIVPRGAAGGLGVLQITNLMDQDAVLKLKAGGLWRMVYVRSRGQATVQGIRPGTYTLMFTSGRDWDNQALKFRDHPIYFQFEKTTMFTEKRSFGGRTDSVRAEITLVAVPNGSTDVKPVREKDF